MEIGLHLNSSLVIGISGLFLFVFGVILSTAIFPNLIDKGIRKDTALDNESEAFKHWIKPPPLQFKVYIFNVTNPQEIAAGGKPVVSEMGPYVYTEYMAREIIDFHNEDDTLTYITHKKYVFNQEKSGRFKETDEIVLINPALMGALLFIDKIIPIALPIINEAIPFMFPDQKSVFSKFVVKDLLFSGVPINCSNSAAHMICKNMDLHLPITVTKVQNSPNFIFSFFKHKNNSFEGPYRIYRGRITPTKVGSIKMYKNKEKLEVWPLNTSCNIIQGTDSTIFPPFLNKNQLLYIFVPDVCRSMFAEFHKVIKVGNVIAFEYVGSRKNFADPLKYSDNLCLCEEERSTSFPNKKKLVCPREGAILLSKCYKSPVHFSQPHFFGAHKDYQNFVVGLLPNKTKHQTFVQIEPKTGVPIKGYRRLQINMDLRSIKQIDILNNSRSGLFPLVWIEEGFELDNNGMYLLEHFYFLLTIMDCSVWLMIVIGFAMLTGAVTYYVYNRNFTFKSEFLNKCISSKSQNCNNATNQMSEQLEFSNRVNCSELPDDTRTH